MKMKNSYSKKVLCLFVVVSTILSSSVVDAALTTPTEAMEGYGIYPQSELIDVQTSQNFTPTNFETFRFSVKTSDTGTVRNYFTLLDRDAEGNYLVIAATDFNTNKKFYSGTDGKLDTWEENSSVVHYDPKNENSIAYFLSSNADWQFKHNGGAGGYKLPSEIKSHIISNREWTIEPEYVDKPTDERLALLNSTDLAHYNEWLSNRETTPRTIVADIVLPSYTELKYYADKIGSMVEMIAMSRSMFSQCAISATGKVTYSNRIYRVTFTNGSTPNSKLDRGQKLDYAEGNVRYLPMFWLDKDFFKNVGINPETAGSEVLKQVRQYSPAEVKSLYTLNEITSIYSNDEIDNIMEFVSGSYDTIVNSGIDLEAMGYPAEKFSGYWNYPVHKAFTDRVLVSGGAAPGGAPAENVFYVKDADGNDRSFVLLDRDVNGNYLVIVDEDYGTHSYSTLCEDGNSAVNTLDESEWKFDTSNKKSIGYWLNNGFLTNGNGGKKLPQSVIDNLVEADWDVEDNISTLGTISSSVTGYDDYIALKNSKTGVTTVRGKIALPSRTEFVTYKSKISADNNTQKTYKNWGGYYTRTGVTEASVVNNEVKYTNYFYHICGSNGTQATANLVRDGSLAKDNIDAYPVRPIFWLEEDFFTTQKIEISKAGTNVKKCIKSCGYADLSAIYNDDELEELGFDVENLPKIKNIVLVGPRSIGSLNEIIYKFESQSGKKEKSTLIEKYSSLTEDGSYIYLGNISSLLLGNDDAKKYIKIGVLPSDEDGNKGKRYFIIPFKAKPFATAVKACVITDGINEISSLDNSYTSISADISLTDTNTVCEIKIAQYGADNSMKRVKMIETDGSNTDYSIGLTGLSLETDDYVLLMVGYKDSGKPIYLKKIG
jgi:hypothetical protein